MSNYKPTIKISELIRVKTTNPNIFCKYLKSNWKEVGNTVLLMKFMKLFSEMKEVNQTGYESIDRMIKKTLRIKNNGIKVLKKIW